MVLRNRILETEGVLGLAEFESVLDPDSRRITISATINTQYGAAELSGAI